MAKSAASGKKPRAGLSGCDPHGIVVRTTNEIGKEADNPPNYHERIRNFYKNPSTRIRFYVKCTSKSCGADHQADGGRLLLLHLPNRRSYQNEVDKLFPAEYAQHIRVTRELAARVGASFYAFKFPEEIGLKDSDYVDYCHMAKSGAEACTKWMVETIEKENLMSKQ